MWTSLVPLIVLKASSKSPTGVHEVHHGLEAMLSPLFLPCPKRQLYSLIGLIIQGNLNFIYFYFYSPHIEYEIYISFLSIYGTR